VLLLMLPVAIAFAADEQRFISCPVYRDTDSGKKSGCWLADDPVKGVRYDVSSSPAKPDWNFAVLVEGRRATVQADVCGGVVLDPVRVSVLRDQPCTRAMIPAEGYSGRIFVLPKRNVAPLYAPRDPATPPFKPRSFAVTFDFGSDFVTYQLTDYYLDQIAYYALDSAPARLEIIGYAASSPVSVSGQTIVEPAALARRRAEKVAQWMRLRGVPADRLKLAWRSDPAPRQLEAADGLEAPSLRRVEITVTPDAAARRAIMHSP
jgi:outer membrane protein OmpA-like peptidoglycan-associated protein